jgi:hypothetical protein
MVSQEAPEAGRPNPIVGATSRVARSQAAFRNAAAGLFMKPSILLHFFLQRMNQI